MKIFTKQTQSKSELTKRTSKSRINHRKSNILSGSVIALILLLTPFIYQLYEGVPKAETWETPFFTLEKGFYKNVQVAVWVYLGKFIPLLICILWFFTCKHWWYHAIIIPIAMYAFQLFSAMNSGSRFIDEVEIYYVIPIMMVIAPIVYWVRLRLFEKYVLGIDLKKIEEELEAPSDLEVE